MISLGKLSTCQLNVSLELKFVILEEAIESVISTLSKLNSSQKLVSALN